MSILDNLPHTCSAYRRTRAKDNLGGGKDSYGTALFTGRACWRQATSDREATDYEKKGIRVTHKVYFVTNPSVDERDVIKIGTQTLRVVSAADPDCTVGTGIAYRVMTEDVSTSTKPSV